MPQPGKRTVEDIRNLLEGPVNSIPTTFTKEGELDVEGIRNIVETGIASGSSVTLLTAGDSQFEFLSDEELTHLTQLVVEQSAGRSLTVAASKRRWTGKELEFAAYCRDLGADVLMLLPSDQMLTSPDLADYYRAVAQIMPVMLVGFPRWELLDQLLDEPRICCFKEDGTEAYAVQTMHRYGNRWKMMTGGVLWRHFTQWPFGCRAFMAWSSCWVPDVSRRYWQALLNNDLAAAGEVVAQIEAPLFALEVAYPGGWQTIWRGALEIKRVAQRYRRAPAHSLTDEEIERLKGDLWQIPLLG